MKLRRSNTALQSVFLRENATVCPACCDYAMAYASTMAGWRRGPNISESNVITRRYSSYTPQVRNFSLQYTSGIHPPLMSIQLAGGRLEAVGIWTAVRLVIRRPLVNTRSVQRSEEDTVTCARFSLTELSARSTQHLRTASSTTFLHL